MATKPITNVLFDLDGTLADTAPDLADALNHLLEENNQPPLPFAAIRPMVSHGGIYMVCQAFSISSDDPRFKDLRERFLSIYASFYLTSQSSLFSGIPEVLDQIEASGRTWGIVTNKMESLTLPLVKALNLSERAGCIVCGDTVANSKPHPAPMLHACRVIGCEPSDTLFIGDAEKDVIAGHNANMHTLVARYGYLGEQDTPENWGADGIIDSPEEILEWLKSSD